MLTILFSLSTVPKPNQALNPNARFLFSNFSNMVLSFVKVDPASEPLAVRVASLTPKTPVLTSSTGVIAAPVPGSHNDAVLLEEIKTLLQALLQFAMALHNTVAYDVCDVEEDWYATAMEEERYEVAMEETTQAEEQFQTILGQVEHCLEQARDETKSSVRKLMNMLPGVGDPAKIIKDANVKAKTGSDAQI